MPWLWPDWLNNGRQKCRACDYGFGDRTMWQSSLLFSRVKLDFAQRFAGYAGPSTALLEVGAVLRSFREQRHTS